MPNALATYRIAFAPHAEMFRHANEPLLLLRELRQLGDLAVTCDESRLPAFEAMDPEGAYFRWTMRLVTAHPRERIVEVFEFVEDVCDLAIEIEDARPALRKQPQRPMRIARWPGAGGRRCCAGTCRQGT